MKCRTKLAGGINYVEIDLLHQAFEKRFVGVDLDEDVLFPVRIRVVPATVLARAYDDATELQGRSC